jgi:predicted MFS family arabinose efflux permease
MPERYRSPGPWQNLWVRLAVALAFADASIVVLALPQIVDRLHVTISGVVWVIVAYNLALIAGAAAVLLLGRRLRSTRALVAGLALFGLASIGCGAANSLHVLVPLRCAQGVGGALILCSSLSLFAGSARPGDSPLYGWSAAAAIGAAVGPAAGGILTQLFSWRAIFFAQAPVAAFAAIAVLAARPRPADALAGDEAAERLPLDPLTANAALALLSAGLIGALFLVVIELINAWLVTPIGAAAVVSTIPVATAIAERLVRGRSPMLLGAAGAVLVALGLLLLGLITHQELGLVVLALALCGTGLGLGFPGLTTAALRSRGVVVARAARTIAARDAGLVLGLLLLTPVFVNQLNTVPNKATQQAAGYVVAAPLPLSMKGELAIRLEAAVAAAPVSRPPDIAPVFAKVGATATASQRVELAVLQKQLDSIIQRAATHAFRRPYIYAALLALLVLPLLGLRLWYVRRTGANGWRRSAPTGSA